MDLQDFNVDTLYFENTDNATVAQLLSQATDLLQGDLESPSYRSAETKLLQAYQYAPDNLSVLIRLYRFYFYQHRHEDALFIAQQLLASVAPRIDFPAHWRNLRSAHLAQGVMTSIGFVRFYLLTLKGAGHLQLHLGEHAEGIAMLRKVVEMDSADRLGARQLLETLPPPAGSTESLPIQASNDA